MAKVKSQQQLKQPFLKLSGKAYAGWAIFIGFSFVALFYVGILVGRGSIYVDIEKKKLSVEVNSFAEKKQSIKHKNIGSSDEALDLIFHETLKKKEKNTTKNGKATVNIAGGKRSKIDEKPKNKTKKSAPKDSVKKKIREKKVADVVYTNKELYKYAIQVGAFRGQPDAKKTVAEFKKKGYYAYYSKALVKDDEIWYRVKIGYYKDKMDAKKTLSKLEKSKIDGFLVTR